MKYLRLVSVVLMAVGPGWFGGADAVGAVRWDVEGLAEVPEVWADPERSVEGVEAIFYEGLPWKGKATRVFAYYGVPEVGPGEKVPAMVLVHGGGGSAFVPWVRLWVERGYAAIAMDTCGCVSSGGYRNHPRHEDGGPPGWGGFDQIDWAVEDQWTYHAVADVILGHSLIRSLPEVDAERTGITGISWGGYLTCIVAGVDHRFKFAAPVYGCGFLGENSAWLGTFEKMGEEKAAKWLGLWDPSEYLPKAQMPMLWVTGTNDFAYPMDSLKKSYRLYPWGHTLCVRVRMKHGHGGPGERPEEIRAMADAILKGGVPLAQITGSVRLDGDVWTEFESETRIVKAEFNYTIDNGKWQERKWETVAATLDADWGRASATLPEGVTVYYFNWGRASATLPEGVTVYYFNLIDERGLVVSSKHKEIPSR